MCILAGFLARCLHFDAAQLPLGFPIQIRTIVTVNPITRFKEVIMLASEICRSDRHNRIRGWTRHETVTIAEKAATRIHHLDASAYASE